MPEVVICQESGSVSQMASPKTELFCSLSFYLMQNPQITGSAVGRQDGRAFWLSDDSYFIQV